MYRGLVRSRLLQPFVPSSIERQPYENQQQADGGAAGAFDPDVDGKGQSAGYEYAGDPGITPATVGAGKIGFGFPHAEEGDDGEAVEDPGSEDEEIGEFLESSGQGH